MEKEIKIPLSKVKIVILLLLGLGFVFLGGYMAWYPEVFVSTNRDSPIFFRIIGCTCLAFFGLVTGFVFKKLWDGKPGLIISERGIYDNSNASSLGWIEWKDIRGFQTVKVQSTKILIVHVEEADPYLAKAKNALAKKAMSANNRLYGSPISIIASSLKINFKELEKLVLQSWEEWKNSQP